MIAAAIIALLMLGFIIWSVSYTLGYNKGAQDERQNMEGMKRGWGQPEPHEPEYSDPADWWKKL